MTRRVVLDTSSYQGNVNFADIKSRSGEVQGAIIKATEGPWSGTNPYFDEQYGSALGAFGPGGVGFYTFWHPDMAGTSDSQLFVNKVSGHWHGLGLWLDCETANGVPPYAMLGRALEDLHVIQQAAPMRTGIYSAKWWWDPNTIGSVAAHMETWPFWVASYTSGLPVLPVPWTTSLFWQFTDNYMGLGIDASVFLGTDKQWEWLTGNNPVPPGPGPHPLAPLQETKDIQIAVHAVADGIFGKDTDARTWVVREMRNPANRGNRLRVRYLQQVMAFGGASADGLWGPVTQSHWLATVVRIQAALGLAQDGMWGPNTDRAYFALDPIR